MTREEAIKLIDTHTVCFYNEIDSPTLQALHLAIEALKILGDDGIVNCCGCTRWKTDGGAMMMCELWNTPMGDFDYCSYGKREKPTIPCFTESAEAYKAWTGEKMGGASDLISRADAEISDYAKWLEDIIVKAETLEWLCEDSTDEEWCEKNCNYESIQAECLRHLYEVSKGGDTK